LSDFDILKVQGKRSITGKNSFAVWRSHGQGLDPYSTGGFFVSDGARLCDARTFAHCLSLLAFTLFQLNGKAAAKLVVLKRPHPDVYLSRQSCLSATPTDNLDGKVKRDLSPKPVFPGSEPDFRKVGWRDLGAGLEPLEHPGERLAPRRWDDDAQGRRGQLGAQRHANKRQVERGPRRVPPGEVADQEPQKVERQRVEVSGGHVYQWVYQ